MSERERERERDARFKAERRTAQRTLSGKQLVLKVKSKNRKRDEEV